jgi:hypothetical protein
MYANIRHQRKRYPAKPVPMTTSQEGSFQNIRETKAIMASQKS